MHCHHEKLVVIDDDVAFVGGIDLTDLGSEPQRRALLGYGAASA